MELGHNIIGSDGGVALAKGLEENKFLVCLELQNNSIGAEGALEFARVLDKEKIGKTGLSTLNIACNNIGDVGGSMMQIIAEQKIIGNLIINGNQVGVCNCKSCILVNNVDPDHWAFEVGKFDTVVLDIDDNGGNLTASNNSTEFERDGDSGGIRRGPLAVLKPRIEKDTGPQKIGFKPPRPKIDAYGNRIRDKDSSDLNQRLREAGMAKEGKNYLEMQLENAAGGLGKMTAGSKMDRDGGDGTTGMEEGDGTTEAQPLGQRGEGAPVGRRGAKLKGKDVYKGVGVGMLARIEAVDNETSDDETSEEGEEGQMVRNGSNDNDTSDEDNAPGKHWWEEKTPAMTPTAMDHSTSEPLSSPKRLSHTPREREEDPPPPPKQKRRSVVEAAARRQKGVMELKELLRDAEEATTKMKEDLGDLLLAQPGKNR